MSNSRSMTLALVVVLAILHQDAWNWNDATLVGGWLPMGLAWHAGFSVVASVVWGGVVLFAWPGDPLSAEERA